MAGVKGRSGRKPTRPSITPALRAYLAKKSASGKTHRQEVVEKLVELAKDGDVQAIKLILERVDGRVPQPVTGDEDEPLPVVLRYVNDWRDGG